MPNPTGVNGYGIKNQPPDDVLKASLLLYSECNLSREQKLASLVDDYGYAIKLTKLAELEKDFAIPSKRRLKPPKEVVTQAIIDEVEKDHTRRNGPDYIQVKLRLEQGLHVGRDQVSNTMHIHFPEDFVKRFPGRQLIRQNRTAHTLVGPYHELHADGHEKLSASGLRMGDIGFSLYGYKDKWTCGIPFLRVMPESCSAASGGHLFLDFVEQVGYIPLQLTTDKGPEIGYQHAFMVTLREMYAPEFDPVEFPPHVILKSTNNTPIEGFWRILSDKCGKNIKEQILQGKDQRIFDPTQSEHSYVLLFQQELDAFCRYWNNHTIRRQDTKLMPSGHVPAHAMDNPSQYGGIDCRIEVPKEAVSQLRQVLVEDTDKTRDDCFQWYSDEFAVWAQLAFEEIGRPNLTLESAWDVFRRMALMITS
ncbi:hypothetical protein GYMLUDRAFT_1016107 [Collybiopsis luxurians FD-317 M1]|uniref:Unplaced genomic scaffold GYMLUscaffold_50, whole genome shotgun sequence n=1 Tax=Collybiopsis luxurians FD-317 M1 TaxID=944289 RepID=A0A0D0BN38_9AGAR|nr:hypothetical protein GYMLUDRAFT_1016107 [Collybiopsis luxurians FD-317 M1]